MSTNTQLTLMVQQFLAGTLHSACIMAATLICSQVPVGTGQAGEAPLVIQERMGPSHAARQHTPLHCYRWHAAQVKHCYHADITNMPWPFCLVWTSLNAACSQLLHPKPLCCAANPQPSPWPLPAQLLTTDCAPAAAGRCPACA